jgi:hypothetical protein
LIGDCGTEGDMAEKLAPGARRRTWSSALGPQRADLYGDAARQHLGFFTAFPFFQRLFQASGFAEEADRMEQGAGPITLSNRLLDAVCLLWPLARCREQFAAFRAAVVELARTVMRAFRR